MTTPFCLSPILRFDKGVLIIFTISPHVPLIYRYKTVLFHGLLAGFVNWYMYVYMYFWDRWYHLVTVWIYIFGDKWIFHKTLTFYSFCFSLHLEVACSLIYSYIPFIVKRKAVTFKKDSIILFGSIKGIALSAFFVKHCEAWHCYRFQILVRIS